MKCLKHRSDTEEKDLGCRLRLRSRSAYMCSPEVDEIALWSEPGV